MLAFLSLVKAQVEDFEMELEIEAGQATRKEFIVLPLGTISTAVLFHWPLFKSECPGKRYGEFLLPKVNPTKNKYLIEENTCTSDGSPHVFSPGFVYEVRTYQGDIFYLEPLKLDIPRLIVHVTKSNPIERKNKPATKETKKDK